MWKTEKIVKDRLYTFSQACREVGITRMTLYRWKQRGWLKLCGVRTFTGQQLLDAHKKYDQLAYRRKAS